MDRVKSDGHKRKVLRGGLKGRHKRLPAVPAKAGYVVVRLPDGTTAHARRSRDGSFIVVEPEEKPSSSDLSESSYRELMAVLEMEDTGRSRRGSL